MRHVRVLFALALLALPLLPSAQAVEVECYPPQACRVCPETCDPCQPQGPCDVAGLELGVVTAFVSACAGARVGSGLTQVPPSPDAWAGLRPCERA